MRDFMSALGLVFAIEGLLFAAFPAFIKVRMSEMLQTPDQRLRMIGLLTAVIGVGIVFYIRRG
jgi:uncharacterized protein YjeT (DUF2065 family)